MSFVVAAKKKRTSRKAFSFYFRFWLHLGIIHIPSFDPQWFGLSFEAQLFFEPLSEIGEMRRAIENGDLGFAAI